MEIRCLAIDDEPLALKQIAGYIQKIPFLKLEATCSNAFEAMEILNSQVVDLMFVDINMPDLNGLDFVKSIEQKPLIIFTTAYSDYAIEGFKVDAIDYLLKPFYFSEFSKAAQKALKQFKLLQKSAEKLDTKDDFLFIKSEYKMVRINFSDILFIEGMKEYVRIHLYGQKPVMSLLSMKSLEEKLPENRFMRVHRSYIVNLEKITTIERFRIVFDTIRIPVSENYKEKFQTFLKERFLE